LNKVMAMDVSSLNRSVISGSESGSPADVDNGKCFWLAAQSSTSGQKECWTLATATTGSLAGLWMAATPPVPVTVDGTLIYRGLNDDPRRFYNVGGMVFDAFRPHPGDIITLSGDCLTGSAEAAYAVAVTNMEKLLWASAPVSAALCLRYLATTYISIGSGAIGTHQVAAYKFEVLANSVPQL
jgi:hypothetical protein